MKKYKVKNYWTEEVMYLQHVVVEAESFEEAVKLSENPNISWELDDFSDSMGDGGENYLVVTDVESGEDKEFRG
jgi:hypothetical protein